MRASDRSGKAAHYPLGREIRKLAGAKDNFDKRLGGWRGSVPLQEPFLWSDGPVRILGVWFGPGLQLEKKWLEVRAKVEANVFA